MISTIPSEILFLVAGNLEGKDLNSLLRTSRHLFMTLNCSLYQQGMLRRDGWPLIWAILNNQSQTLENALNTGAKTLGEALALAAEYGQEKTVERLLAVESANFAANYDTEDEASPANWTALERIYYHSVSVSEQHQSYLGTLPKWIDHRLCDYDSLSPLSRAIRGDYLKIAQLLVNSGKLDIDLPEYKGRTPLSYAVQFGSLAMVKLLVNSGKVNVDSHCHDGRTPLSWSVQHSNHLSLSGQFTNIREGKRDPSSRETPLDTSILEVLLGTGKVNPNSRDRYGRTPLSYAAEFSKPAVAKLLLETGVVGIDQESDEGCSPFFYSVEAGNTATAELLLNSNMIYLDPKNNDAQGAFFRFMYTCSLTLSHGESPATISCPFFRDYLKALRASYVHLLNILVECQEIDLDEVDDNGKTPFMTAQGLGADFVRPLIESGQVRLDEPDLDGRTPLSYAAEEGDHESIKLLIETGQIDCDSRDLDGRSPLSYASESGNIQSVRLLLETGKVDCKSQDDQGRTPISYAEGREDKDIYQLFVSGCSEANAARS
ncbi:ankyrin repeat-containing domain protein [Aspergillus ambiguus]|uniref:ankyrin repeat domain-containing protein n=1 Tax=Aspergillus ambiguus TaxID=176160 RepID=UPI003CCD99F7